MSTKHITKTITLPDGEPTGDVMTIRKLSGKHLRRAAEDEMFEQVALMERMASIQTRVKAAMGKDEAAPVAPAAEPVAAVAEAPAVVAEPNPMSGYSKPSLILKGMLSVEGEAFPDEAAREAYVDDLSQEDTDYAAKQILRLSAPKLFLSAAEREVAQKNA